MKKWIHQSCWSPPSPAEGAGTGEAWPGGLVGVGGSMIFDMNSVNCAFLSRRVSRLNCRLFATIYL